MQVDWEKCFDVGILQGRVLQVLLLSEKAPIADATMRLEASREEAKQNYFYLLFFFFLQIYLILSPHVGGISLSINKCYVLAGLKKTVSRRASKQFFTS